MEFLIFYAFILDLIFGDPKFLYHPICAIGKLISKTESFIRNRITNTDKSLYFGGILLFFITISVCFFVPFLILNILLNDYIFIKNTLCIFWAYQILATKSLIKESMKVYSALIKNDILDARLKLSYIVGRDTNNLSKEQIIKATIETVAENLTDGVIAPIFYMTLGGVPLAFLYKAVNTLDSMVGYKNERFLYFGRFSAKADDLFNFIPARISAVLMIIASFLCNFSYKNAVKIFLRDRFNHKSPNAAQTESVCAGALEIQLSGDSYYFGELVKKQTIGEDLRAVTPLDIKKGNILMLVSATLGALLFGGIYAIL